MKQLAYKKGPMPIPESEAWLDSLNGELPEVRIEKHSFQIQKICERARSLLKSIDDTTLFARQTLDMITEMQALEKVAMTWRSGLEWAFKTVRRSDIIQGEEPASIYPEFFQLHRDVWIAYEWNYHRTGRVILHEHLLLCLDRLESTYASSEAVQAESNHFRVASVSVIHTLVDEVLSTVPQSLGDIDHEGNLLNHLPTTSKCKGVGGYFLLWPIRIIMSTHTATSEQRACARATFERIRQCTGMNAALGVASCI